MTIGRLMSRRVKIALGILFFAVFFIHAGVGAYRTLALSADLSSPGWNLVRRNGHLFISRVAAKDAGAMVRPGDEVIALNGQAIRSESQIAEFFKRSQPGTPYTLIVQRDDSYLQFRLQSEPFPWIWFTLLSGARMIIPAIFLITGFAVFLLKPMDKQATLLAGMFALFGGAVPVQTAPDESAFIIGIAIFVELAAAFFAAVFFHFFLIFPETSHLLRRFPRLGTYLYVPHLLTGFLYSLINNILLLFFKEQVPLFRGSFGFVLEASAILTLAYVAGGLVMLLLNYGKATLASRRKMRVVVAGSIAGFLPPLLLIGGAFLLYTLGADLSRISQPVIQWVVLMCFFAFSLFPLSFAYAIVRHQVIPVRLIVRRGVRYLLVSRGFIIIETMVVFALLGLLLTGDRIEIFDRWGRRADILVTGAATLSAVFLLRTVNRRVMSAIDRRFFREAYNTHQILSDLAVGVRSSANVERMLEMVVDKIEDALHTESIAILLREDESGDFVLAASSIKPHSESEICIELGHDSLVVKRLAGAAQPLSVEMDDRGVWLDGALEDQDRDVLRELRSTLLLPISAQDRLLAIISLGRRLGDLPFSREDRQMLMALSWQIGLALENAELIHRAAEERRFRREIEIAADVQRRLFPERPPEFDELDLSGLCIPARGVGGDYYDFLVLNRRQVGVAVADVAGKGISAALLMSIVQASLRSQLAGSDGHLSNIRLTDLVSSMNTLLHRSTGPHSFASFFYAQLDLSTRVLTYVNAGHNPPLLVRAAGSPVTGDDSAQAMRAAAGAVEQIQPIPAHTCLNPISLLNRGGTVIGAFSNACYEQESIQLNAGDVLIAYTDGLTEARSPDGEEFGDTRLLNLAGEFADLSASDLSEQIVRGVQDWCRDHPRHDDLTLVIMKIR